MTAAVLAIAGFPPFAGFFSKDAILYAAFLQGTGGKLLWFVGLVTALLTSLYMFRLWYLTFMGEPRSEVKHHHATPLSMLVPLVILGILSVCGGWIGIERFSAYLAPVAAAHRPMPTGNPFLELLLSIAAVLVALEGWLIADKYYRRKPERPATSRRRSPRWLQAACSTSITSTKSTARSSSSRCSRSRNSFLGGSWTCLLGASRGFSPALPASPE